MRIPIAIIAAAISSSPCLFGADEGDTLRNVLQAGYEHALEFGSEDGSVTPLLELFESLEEDPLDLNVSSESEIEQIPGLGPLIAFRIVSQRSIQPFQKVEDLQRIEGVTPELLRSLNPFVTVKRRSVFSPQRLHVRTRGMQSAIGQSGTVRDSYPGSPDKLYSRIVAHIEGSSGEKGQELINFDSPRPSLTLGLVTEKDPGERNYLDFVSGNVSASIPGLSARFFLGDFVCEGGQGLVLWRSGGTSKGTEATSGIARSAVGIRPSFSTDQTWFFRGAAATFDLKQGTVSLFCSNKTLDAGTDSSGVVTRLDSDGLHRTETELKTKGSLREVSYGVRMASELTEGVQVGASALTSRFNRRVHLPGIFGFDGEGSSSVGLDASLARSNMRIFGEVAQDFNRARAGVVGIVLNPCRETNIALLARYYPREYKTFHGSGFGANGGNNVNESGLYCGVTFRPVAWMNVNASWDQFVFPWRTSAAMFPSQGKELVVQSEMDLSSRTSLTILLRSREKPAEIELTSPAGLAQTADNFRSQQNYRATLMVGSSQSVVWRSRVEVVTVRYSLRPGSEIGMLVLQDVSFDPVRHVSLEARVIAFDTPTFDSRVYEYEAEVPGACQTPGLYGKGLRWYFIGRSEFVRHVSISLKYAQTRRESVRTCLFTGESALPQSDDHLTFQIDVKL
jgi:hypothetical protein